MKTELMKDRTSKKAKDREVSQDALRENRVLTWFYTMGNR